MEQGPRRSVAELAGRFSCQTAPSTADDVNKPVRRRPPRTLQLPTTNDANQAQDEQKKSEASSQPPRKNRNSALIEKLQANLALSPTTLLPSPMSPGAGKPPAPCFTPQTPQSPVSPTVASKPCEETPTSFETPAEGNVLQSINKGRARHSIKRRPPSRRLRKSSGDEGGTEENNTTSPASEHAATDGKENDVFEKQNVQEEESESASMQEEEQNQTKESPDSEESPPGEKENKVCVEICVTTEDDKPMEKEMPDQDQTASVTSECTKQEPDKEAATKPQSDPDIVMEDKEEQEEKKDDNGVTPMEECKDCDQ